MWAAGLIALFIAVIGMTTVAYGLHPPSHVETIEPSKVFADPRFSKVGQLVELPDGTYGYPIWQHVQMPRFGSPGFSPF